MRVFCSLRKNNQTHCQLINTDWFDWESSLRCQIRQCDVNRPPESFRACGYHSKVVRHRGGIIYQIMAPCQLKLWPFAPRPREWDWLQTKSSVWSRGSSSIYQIHRFRFFLLFSGPSWACLLACRRNIRNLIKTSTTQELLLPSDGSFAGNPLLRFKTGPNTKSHLDKTGRPQVISRKRRHASKRQWKSDKAQKVSYNQWQN